MRKYLAILALAASGLVFGCGPGPLAEAQAVDPTERRIFEVVSDLERRWGIAVSREDGRLLRRLIEENRVKRAVEIGTYRGYSGLWMALGLRRTGGTLTSYDIDPQVSAEAQANFDRAEVKGGVVTQIVGDAHQEVLKLEPPIDFVFIDADKEGYLDYLQKLLPKMSKGGLIVAHNVRAPEPDPAFMRAIQTDPRLETTFANMDGAGMSISRVK